MISSQLGRQFGQLARDPVLRRWLAERMLGRRRRAPVTRQTPPYLNVAIQTGPFSQLDWIADLAANDSLAPLELSLAGHEFVLEPGREAAFLNQKFGDTECLLAMHRFAWLGNTDADGLADWGALVWRRWMEIFGTAAGWPWHPYTVAERLINIVQFALRYGLPGPRAETIKLLHRHGQSIFENLEYFGDTHTGNHLANNGRGLYLAGLKLGRQDWIEAGAAILVNEAGRLFLPSGALREGSTHYHLLATRWYAECWLAARQGGRPEQEALGQAASRALAFTQYLAMPGGLALIGDVSPDCPPEYLDCLWDDTGGGWYSTLEPDEIAALSVLRGPPSAGLLADQPLDGWLRRDFGAWSGLWHAPKSGWTPQPGHGHQDAGGFELHHNSVPLFRDLGRRSYDPAGAPDTLGASHNSLRIDGHDPYPPNKPYYSEDFRCSVTGTGMDWQIGENEVDMRCPAFSRLRGVGSWRRQWRFSGDKLTITDSIEGSGRHRIERRLHTTLPATREASHIRLGGYRVSADAEAIVENRARWKAYGRSEPATSTLYSENARLPWRSMITVEAPDGAE